MKNLPISACLLYILLIASFYSCVKTDDFEIPALPEEEVLFDGNTTSIATVKGHYNFETGEIYTFWDTGIYMEGFVISSDEGGNFYKKLVLQDRPSNPTAGIQILVDDASLFNSYEIGRKLYVQLDGLSLWYNNGVLQLGKQNRGDVVATSRSLIDEHLIRTSITAEIEPLKVEIQDFNENYKNLYIRLENVQFNKNLVRDDKRFSFSGETIDQYDGERQLESCKTGATTILSTSTFADFRSLILPQTSGNIDGVLTKDFYDDFYILVVNTPEALEFGDGERCDPKFLDCGENDIPGVEVVFQESFETITTARILETKGWTNLNVSGGSMLFKPATLMGNRHVEITAYNTTEAPLEAWLVSPGINLDGTNQPVLSFDILASYDNSTILSVLATENFTGNPLTTEWVLLDANIPVGPSRQNGTHYLRSHIDISCLEGEVNFAFKYSGAAPEKSTTYNIDNIRVTED